MGYPAAYRQDARPSHGFQGETNSGSPRAKPFTDRGRPIPKRFAPLPERKPPPARFKPGARPKGNPFGKKRPKAPNLKKPFPRWFLPSSLALGWALDEFLSRPEPQDYGYLIPEGSGWVQALQCSPSLNSYDPDQQATTVAPNIGIGSTTCLVLQAFTGSMADPDMLYTGREMILWWKHRTLFQRWASRNVWNRPGTDPVHLPRFGPAIHRAPTFKPYDYSQWQDPWQRFTPPGRPLPQVTPKPLRVAANWKPDPRFIEQDEKAYGPSTVRRPIPAEQYWPGGAVRVAPRVYPRGRPIPAPRPVPVPAPLPNIKPPPAGALWWPSIETSYESDANGNIRVREQLKKHPRRFQKRETKPHKPKSAAMRRVQELFGATTEALDFLDVMYYAIPKAHRVAWLKANVPLYWSKKKGRLQRFIGPKEKLAAMAALSRFMNAKDFVKGYIKNAIEDRLYGLIGQAQQKHYQRSWSAGNNQWSPPQRIKKKQDEILGHDSSKDWSPTDWTDAMVDAIVDDVWANWGRAPVTLPKY